MKQTPWFERKFAPISDNGLLPSIIERLDGTEYRLAGKLADEDDIDMTAKKEGKWSIMEEVGHLYTLEPLYLGRMRDIVAGKEVMRAADLTNAATNKGKFNAYDIDDLLDEFGERREDLLSFLRTLKPADLEKSSLHPRLGTPMRIIDLAYFVAEHDDHHLVKISEMAGY